MDFLRLALHYIGLYSFRIALRTLHTNANNSTTQIDVIYTIHS